MPRVGYAQREKMASGDQKFWDEVAAGRGGEIPNHFRTMLLSPELGARVNNVGEYIRKMSDYDGYTREIVILAVSGELKCEFMWSIHERSAPKAGLSMATINALRRRSTDGLSPRDKTIAEYTWAFMHNKVTDEAFKAVVKLLGERGAVALGLHVGYANGVSLFLNAFQVELPKGLTPLLAGV